MTKTVKNWGGTVKFTPKRIEYPQTQDEIVALVRQAHQQNQKIRLIGSGHSWTRLIETDAILVSLDAYQGLVEVDKNKQQAVVKAGTKLKLLGQLLHEQGLAMENLGDIDVQSIAGALSTGTHGTGVNFGTLATQIEELTLITGTGDVLVCSENQNADVFKAAQISLGALGIISTLKLKLVPAYKLKYVSDKANFDEVLQNIEDHKDNNRHFEFYWFPFTKTVQLKKVNVTDEPVKDGGIIKKMNDLLLENGFFSLLSMLSRAFPKFAKTVSKISAWGVAKGTYINYSHKIFATKRLVRFYEMEYNIPAVHFATVMKEIETCINEQQFKVHFPIECRWVKADDIMISPANQRNSAYIAVHMYKGMPYEAYFNALEAIFRKYGGRPHYGKMNTLKKSDFEQLYPQWSDFNQIRQKLDPNDIFLNDYLKSILV